MADATAAWNKVFTHGSKSMKERLMKVHSNNPKFQEWLQSSGHGAGESVRQASKEIVPSKRATRLLDTSSKGVGFGAGKNTKAVGGEYGGGGNVAPTHGAVKVYSPDEIEAMNRARGTVPVNLSPEEKAKKERMMAIAAAASRATRKSRAQFDVPTLDEELEQMNEIFNRPITVDDPLDRFIQGKIAKHHSNKYSPTLAPLQADSAKLSKERSALNNKIRQIKSRKSFKNKSHKNHPQSAAELEDTFSATKPLITKHSKIRDEIKKITDQQNADIDADLRTYKNWGLVGLGIKKGIKAMKNKLTQEQVEQMNETRRMSASEKLDRAFKDQENRRLTRKIGELEALGRTKEAAELRAQAQKAAKSVTESNQRVNNMSEEKSYARVLAERAIQNHVQNLIEQSNNDYDSNEYDYEGDMAMSQLKSIITNAQRLHDMLEENTNLPEWVQSKITLAEDYILTAANYMEGEMNEEVEQVDEVSIKTLAAAAAASRDSSKFVSHAKKRYGEKVAADVQNAADIADDRLKKKTSGGLDLLSQRIPVRTTQTGEANKQDLAKRKRELKQDALYRKPVKPMASEEVEQMNTDENESNILKNIRTAKTVLGLQGLNISAAEQAHSQLATHGNITKISPNLRRHYLQLSGAVPSDTLHLPPEQFRSVLARLKQVQVKEEGSVPTTAKEKDLAMQHGDPNKITYGDVIKARKKSAAKNKEE